MTHSTVSETASARRYLANRWWLLRGLVAHCVLFVSAAGMPELAAPPAGALPRLVWLAKAVRCEPLILSSFASLVRPAFAFLLSHCYPRGEGCTGS